MTQKGYDFDTSKNPKKSDISTFFGVFKKIYSYLIVGVPTFELLLIHNTVLASSMAGEANTSGLGVSSV